MKILWKSYENLMKIYSMGFQSKGGAAAEGRRPSFSFIIHWIDFRRFSLIFVDFRKFSSIFVDFRQF